MTIRFQRISLGRLELNFSLRSRSDSPDLLPTSLKFCANSAMVWPFPGRMCLIASRASISGSIDMNQRLKASANSDHLPLKTVCPMLSCWRYRVAQLPAVPVRRPSAILIIFASLPARSGCSMAQPIKWVKNRLASAPLSPLKGSGRFILDLAVFWFCNAAVRLETCWASRLINCSVLWGMDIGVCGCAGVWL